MTQDGTAGTGHAGARGDEHRDAHRDEHRDDDAALVERAGEQGDLDTLRRLAAAGRRDALDVLEELEGGRPT